MARKKAAKKEPAAPVAGRATPPNLLVVEIPRAEPGTYLVMKCGPEGRVQLHKFTLDEAARVRIVAD